MVETVVGYIENSNNEYLMIFRNKKENDINEGKWLGIGGHVEVNETKEQAIIREIKEETGLDASEVKFRGTVEFHFNDVSELMYVFKINKFSGDIIECDEGDLMWINKYEIPNLPIWEGDKLFLNRLDDNKLFYFKMFYDDNGLIRSEEYDISKIY